MHIESRLSIVTIPYCYDELESNDEKHDCHVDVVKENEQGELINQTMRPLVLEFKDASGSAHMMSFDWALSCKNSSLNIELEAG